MLRFNSALAGLPVYQPGRPIAEVARELGLPEAGIIKLASNENPRGPAPRAVAAIQAAAAAQHLYPDGSAFALKRKLAGRLGVAPEQLVLGNGSNEILEFIGHALLGPGTNAVVSQYCFAVYPLVTQMMGAQLVTVPARNHGHDLPAMARAITPATRVVFVTNPNNPTGTLAEAGAVREFLAAVPPDVLIALDEAYYEFRAEPQDLLPLIRDGSRPNLLLLRTFSKIYGLAGLRVGYGIGPVATITALEKVRQPFNLNALAQAAAEAALDDEEHVAATRRDNLAGLRFYEAECRRLGLEFVPSHANFLLVRVGDGARVFAAMQRLGVIIRPMGGYQLPEWIRISVGTAAENERCVAALARALETGR